MPRIKVSQPMNDKIISMRFFSKIVIISNPTQLIIPNKNNITHAILSFLLIMKSER